MSRRMPHILELTHTHTGACPTHLSLHTCIYTHKHTPKAHWTDTQNLAFILAFTCLLLRRHRLEVPHPLDHPSVPPSSHPTRPTPPLYQAPRVGLCLHLPAGMQHEVPVQLPEAVKGIFTLCAVVGALLLLLFLLLIPPGGSALPSPRRPPLFLPEGPAFRGWCFLGGYRRAAEPARWGARRGLPEG